VQETFARRFDGWYSDLGTDPYRSTFTYGRRKVNAVVDGVLDGLPPGTRFLDVGCGTGHHVGLLRERGFDVVGVEPGEELRRRAQANNPGASIEDGDVEAMGFETASFDGVLAIEVIRHVPHPDRAVAEIARVLRPGGIAVITAAPRWSLNGYALINQITGRVKVPSFTKSRQSFLSQGEARALMRAAGFSSVEMHGVLLGPWQVIGRISPRLLSSLLRRFEPLDDRLAARPALRGLTNCLVLVGRR